MFIISLAVFVLPLAVLSARNVTNRPRCFNPDLIIHHDYAKLHVVDMSVSIPDSLDWREYDYVTDVKNQESCGSCYIFAAIAALEGQWKNATGDLVVLSEQNVLDCDTLDGGCRGGAPNNVFNFIKTEGGVDTEDSYEYIGEVESSCNYSEPTRGATVSGYTTVGQSDDELLNALVTIGPISVGIDASGLGGYDGGISDGGGCSSQPGDVNHAVTLIGYGTQDDQNFWLIKNSWGEDWGDDGYLKLTRDTPNICGIANHGSYPNV